MVSTWMGDRLGTPCAVGITFLVTFTSTGMSYSSTFLLHPRQRPYHVENTSSRPITAVKQRWAWLVLGWETAWEHHVLLALLFEYSYRERSSSYIYRVSLHPRQRPYHIENTSSRPITAVKQRWAWLVLGWETAWEHHVLLSSLFFTLLRVEIESSKHSQTLL